MYFCTVVSIILFIMGQYLTIGIATDLTVNKGKAERSFGSVENFKVEFEKQFNLNSIYKWVEDEDYAAFELRPEVAEKEWIDFLSDFYRMRYDNSEKEGIIEALKKENNYQEWIKLAKTKSFESYQFDEYLCYPIKGGDRYQLVYASVNQIILSLDGKIMMECYNNLFSFFTKLVKERMQQYKLSDSLVVYITG